MDKENKRPATPLLQYLRPRPIIWAFPPKSVGPLAISLALLRGCRRGPCLPQAGLTHNKVTVAQPMLLKMKPTKTKGNLAR